MDIRGYNQQAWDRQVERGNQWTVPVGPGVIEAARGGRWEVLLPDNKPVPRTWFPEMRGAEVDLELADTMGEVRVKYELPYATATSLSEEELRGQVQRGEPLEFSHTLEDQIGRQTDAWFVISGLYENRHRDDRITAYMPTFVATRATKP
jgi:hypothetical protein